MLTRKPKTVVGDGSGTALPPADNTEKIALPIDMTRNENTLAKKPTGTRGRPPAPEARSRVLLGEKLMGDLKKYRDQQAETLGFSPSIAKTIAILLAAAKR